MIRARLIRGFGANALGQLVNTGLQLLMVPILASHWGLERYGTWLLIATIPSYLLVSDLGFARAAAVDMTMRAANDDRDGALRIYQTTQAFVLVVCSSLLVAAWLLITLLPDHVFATSGIVGATELRRTILLMSTYGILIMGGTVFDGPFQSSGNYATQMTAVAMLWLVEGSAAMVTVVAGGGIVAVALSYVICRILLLSVLAMILHRRAPWMRLGVGLANTADMKRLIRPAGAMMAIPLGNAFVLQGTALAIGWAATATAVPAFTTTRTLVRTGIQLTGIVTRASLPEFTMAHSRGQRDVQTNIIVLILATTLVVLLPVAAVMLVFGPRIIALWTHGVVHAPRLLTGAMAIMMLVNGFWTSLSVVIVAVNRQALFTVKFIGLAIAGVGLTYALSLRLGATGGALSMLVVDLVMAVVVVRIIARYFTTTADLRAAVGRIARLGMTKYRNWAHRA